MKKVIIKWNGRFVESFTKCSVCVGDLQSRAGIYTEKVAMKRISDKKMTKTEIIYI